MSKEEDCETIQIEENGRLVPSDEMIQSFIEMNAPEETTRSWFEQAGHTLPPCLDEKITKAYENK